MPHTKLRFTEPAAALTQVVEDNIAFMTTHGEDFFAGFQNKQEPYATVVTCADSRCQVAAIAQEAFNNIFRIANAGNRYQADKGSVVFGVDRLNTPLLLFVGHTGCGAITAALDPTPGNDTDLATMTAQLSLPRTNTALTHQQQVLAGVLHNVNAQVAEALTRFKSQVAASKLAVVGSVFDLHNQLGKGFGRLHLFNINGATDYRTLKADNMLHYLNDEKRGLYLLDTSTLFTKAGAA